MTMTGYTLNDLGDRLSWNDLRDFIAHLPPTPGSAFYRKTHPQSWWWTPEIDFLGAVLTAVQWGNWQRGGGKGDKPKQLKRPVDKPTVSPGASPTSANELKSRKEKMKSTMERMGRSD
jgi:hypothetical protein